jgi:uncharacterized RDD family membrane protein YckC
MQKPLIDPTVRVVADSVRRRGSDQTAGAEVETQPASTLIEFPGVSRSVPEWRKQLRQRVREVQEQRAREAAEAEAATRAAESVSCALPSGQLELVPDREQAPLNPIVSKALERVDRARRPEHQSTGFAGTTATAAVAPAKEEPPAETSKASPAEVKPRLTIVTQPANEQTQTRPKPVRVISENVEDLALSYLDTCLSVPVLGCDTRKDAAGLPRRMFAGTLDLLLIGVMASPVAAAIEFSSSDWFEPRVMGLMIAVTVVTMFAYLTLSIALTGRTPGMRLLSLRTIDLRTGLIPTGGQSIKRSLGYIFSLALFGLGLVYALVDRDRRTVHDRLSNTIVVRD